MATASQPDLGEDLIQLGKLLSACKSIGAIAQDIAIVKEQLETVERDYFKLNISTPSLTEFIQSLRNCTSPAEKLCKQAVSVGHKYALCTEVMKKIISTGQLTPKQVDELTLHLKSLLVDSENVDQCLRKFQESLQELQRRSERAANEALREEEKLRKEAFGTHTGAILSSTGAWFGRIFTFGLITHSSSFQAHVASNNERYENATRLNTLAERFRLAKNSLDRAMKTVKNLEQRMEGTIQLTKEMVDIIRQVLAQYQYMANLQDTNRQKDDQIAEQAKKLSEQQEELARMREELARAQRGSGGK